MHSGVRQWEKEWPAGSSAPEQTGKVAEIVNNKLIRNGSKIAMDERPDGQGLGKGRKKRKKKSQSWSSELWAPSIMWGLTSYQQSEQELHLINQSWQLLLGPISSTAFLLPLPQLPLSFTFCKYKLYSCPPSKGFVWTGFVDPPVVSENMNLNWIKQWMWKSPGSLTGLSLGWMDCWVMWLQFRNNLIKRNTKEHIIWKTHNDKFLSLLESGMRYKWSLLNCKKQQIPCRLNIRFYVPEWQLDVFNTEESWGDNCVELH